MLVLTIITVELIAFGIGVWAAWDYFWSTKANRERHLQKQIDALQASLEIAEQAWVARAAMHQEADRIRREQSGRT